TIYLRLYPHAFGRVPPGTRPIPSQPPSVADVAALLFAEVLVDAKHIPRAAFFMQISAAAFLQQPAAMSAATGSGTPSGEAFKRLLAKWFETRTHPDDLSNYNLINAANMFRTYPETTPLLRRVVMTDGVIGYQKSQALMFLIQRNGKDEQAFLRSLVIGDKEREEGGELLALAAAGGPGSVAARSATDRRFVLVTGIVAQVWLGDNGPARGNQGACQLRDYALALLIVQNGQNLRDYGYEFPPGTGPNPNQIGYPNYVFTSDEKREAAIQKWREWEQVKEAESGIKPNPFRRIP